MLALSNTLDPAWCITQSGSENIWISFYFDCLQIKMLCLTAESISVVKQLQFLGNEIASALWLLCPLYFFYTICIILRHTEEGYETLCKVLDWNIWYHLRKETPLPLAVLFFLSEVFLQIAIEKTHPLLQLSSLILFLFHYF